MIMIMIRNAIMIVIIRGLDDLHSAHPKRAPAPARLRPHTYTGHHQRTYVDMMIRIRHV